MNTSSNDHRTQSSKKFTKIDNDVKSLKKKKKKKKISVIKCQLIKPISCCFYLLVSIEQLTMNNTKRNKLLPHVRNFPISYSCDRPPKA